MTVKFTVKHFHKDGTVSVVRYYTNGAVGFEFQYGPRP